jgi:hypothetical protein
MATHDREKEPCFMLARLETDPKGARRTLSHKALVAGLSLSLSCKDYPLKYKRESISPCSHTSTHVVTHLKAILRSTLH